MELPQDDLLCAMALSEDLRRVLHRLARQLRHESHGLAVSPLHALLLVAIWKQPGISVGELASLERLRGPTISGHIKAMETLGLVERAPPSPEDRRRTGLIATEKGSALIESIKRSGTDWLARKLAELTPEARQAIRNAIAPLNEMIA